MGEEEKRKGGEKEKEKEKEKMGDGDKDNKKKDKKDESPPIIILRTDLHCEGCAMKVKRAIRSLPGVNTVHADAGNNRVTVTGPADPWEVKERMEAKTKRNVEFVSPANPPKKDKDKVGGDKKPGADSPKQPKKDAAAAAAEADDKKPKEPPESTVMLKIRLHCDGCIDRIKRRIYKVKGVKEVTVDAAKDLITVKGTMDVNSLPSYLTEKLRRSVEIVPAAKKDGGGGGGGGGDKKEKEKDKEDGGGGGGDKMKEEKKKEKAAAAPPPAADVPPPAADVPPPAAPSAAEVNRYDYYGYGYGYGYGYRVEIGHPPQMFSDENPNACTLM